MNNNKGFVIQILERRKKSQAMLCHTNKQAIGYKMNRINDYRLKRTC